MWELAHYTHSQLVHRVSSSIQLLSNHHQQSEVCVQVFIFPVVYTVASQRDGCTRQTEHTQSHWSCQFPAQSVIIHHYHTPCYLSCTYLKHLHCCKLLLHTPAPIVQSLFLSTLSQSSLVLLTGHLLHSPTTASSRAAKAVFSTALLLQLIPTSWENAEIGLEFFSGVASYSVSISLLLEPSNGNYCTLCPLQMFQRV